MNHDAAKQALTTLKRFADRSPMADPRSIGSSLVFHLILLGVASAAALSVATSGEPDKGPRAITAELDPVDNKAGDTSVEGGGSPGALGDRITAALEGTESPATPDSGRQAPADALLAEILPTPAAAGADTLTQTLPGPQTSGLGLTPGPGAGGGGGSGGGSGGGTGRGVGPGTEFFGAREHARSFAYVIDCSGSMAIQGSLDVAKRELIASLNQLPPDASFGVIFYSLHATVLSDPTGQRGLMPATRGNKARVGTQLSVISPDGGTDHMIALRAALALRPEVIFFLTDADLMTNSEVAALLSEAGRTRIQAVEFGRGLEIGVETNPLRRLAASTGGHYRYIDVTRFPKSH